MVEKVGAVEVDVRANLAPYTAGLQQAKREAEQLNAVAQREMGGLTAATVNAAKAMAGLGKSEKEAGVATRALGEAFNVLKASAQGSLGVLPALAGVAGLGGVVLAAQQAVSAFAQWEQQQIQFEGRLRATRGQLGMTGDEITALARQISIDTLTPMDAIRNFALELGRSGEVTTSVLQNALRILPDLALRVGDFGQASRILTESLKNPAEAVKLLRDAGVQFTIVQRDLLENTDGLAQRMQNASVVIQILRDQIGGEANAQGRGAAGGFAALASAVSQFTINIGEAVNRMFGFSEGARKTAEAVTTLNDALFPTDMSARIRALTDDLQKYQDALAEATRLHQQQLALVQSGAAGVLGSRRLETLSLGVVSAGESADRARAQLELAQLSQWYTRIDAEAQALARTEEQLAARFRDTLKAITDQTEGLNRSGNRAEVRARADADRLGITDPAQIRQLVQAYTELEAAQRRIAQAGRVTVFERENRRLEEQIKLFQLGNQEARIQADLNRTILAAERARQPLSDQQKATLEERLRLLERIKTLSSTIESAFESVFSSMTSALAEFAATGKFNFKQLADSIIRDLVRIATQAFIVKPLMQAITGVTNPMIASALGAPASVPTSAPGLATGGSFMVPGGRGGGDKPTMLVGLSPGERVDVTPANNVDRRGPGGGITVINNVQSSKDFEVTQTEREGPDGTRIMEQTFSEVMKRLGRGDGDATLGARFGMRPRTVQR